MLHGARYRRCRNVKFFGDLAQCTAVSYTHLDVYKRQKEATVYIDTEFTTASRTAMLNQVLAGQPKVELDGSPIHLTGEDVYKREAYIRTEHDWQNQSRHSSGTYVHDETS